MDADPSLQPDTVYPTDGSLETIRLLGTSVACATYDSALERIKALAREPRATAVCPSNTHILGEARHNPEFARVLTRFDLVLPDGMPVVWALNFRGAGLKDRVYGPYFMRHALRNTPRPWRHFFFGDSEECLAELRRALVQLHPDIEIVGMLSPPFRPFTEADEVSFADTINRADPDSCGWRCPACRWNSGSSTIRRGIEAVCSLRWAMHSPCSAAAGRSLRRGCNGWG
jgi:N-acetylglucosaminyldiphosphoundecaprenol N-acetyl-beta-D-mannosaminyltransferase